MLAEVDARADLAGTSRAEAVRVLLERALAPAAHDGVDRTQIARRLAMTPAERISRMAEETRRMLALAEERGDA